MEEVFVFSDEELHKALSGTIGKDRDSQLEAKKNPDPGTITMPEVQNQYDLGRDGARKYVGQLLEDNTLIRDWVYRYDPWPPYKRRRVKGYRLNQKQNSDI